MFKCTSKINTHMFKQLIHLRILILSKVKRGSHQYKIVLFQEK